MSSQAPRRNTAKRKADFLIERSEAADLVQALRIIAQAGDESEIPLREVGRVDHFASTIEEALKKTNALRMKVRLTRRTLRAISSVNCDLTLNSPYAEDDDHEECKAIDLVEEFLVAAGRKLGQSIFRSPEDRRGIERAAGVDLEHRDL